MLLFVRCRTVQLGRTSHDTESGGQASKALVDVSWDHLASKKISSVANTVSRQAIWGRYDLLFRWR
jgi:hypothetical protein